MKNVFLLAGALLVAAPQAGAQVTSDEAEIRRTRTESNQAIARHDVPAVLATMVEDFHVSISTGAFRSSRAEMGEAFAMRFEEFEDALYVRTPTTVEISSAGPVASEIGEWVGSWTTAEGPFRTGGRYVAYWKKVEGKWLIHAELYVPLFCEGEGC